MYVRLIGLVLAVFFSMFVMYDIIRMLTTGEWNLTNWRYRSTVQLSPLLLLFGLLLLFERRLIAWLAPLPKDECPACGYSLEHITTEKCPECGIPLTTRWSDAKPDSTANSERPSP